ncbi:MAG: hypothetical protein VKJ04_07830 [Vampirovibrionales bacterium]|nr:hypothetical protein [Vampirovibrionales bacterium]
MQTSFNAPAIRFGLDKTDLLPGQAQAPEGMPAPAPLSQAGVLAGQPPQDLFAPSTNAQPALSFGAKPTDPPPSPKETVAEAIRKSIEKRKN